MLKTGDILISNFDRNGDTVLERNFVVLIECFGSELLVACFTNEVDTYKNEKTAVLLSPEDIDSGAIKKAGIIRLHKLASVEAKQCKWVAGLKRQKIDEMLRKLITITTIAHYKSVHRDSSSFVPGQSRIPYAGRVYDEKEMISLVDSSLDFWLTTGRFAQKFEKKLAEFLGIKYCSLTNSGSSANLLAFMALTSPKLGARQIQKDDEVITVAAGFPTTVAPIIQYGAVPVFVDVLLETYNVDCKQLEAAVSPKTKAVMLAHTLGNPFDLQSIKEFCEHHNLWLIEDNCDSLGSKYLYNGKWLFTGTIGDLGTSSFYPPHHITTGEGGAVYTNDTALKRIVDSFRDWGRDCWCPPGRDNTCQKRFDWQLGELPKGYDHKYTYSHFGYNLRATDMQAAVGCAQLDKLSSFVEARNRHWQLLHEGLQDLDDVFILPEATTNSEPSWFGFLLTLKDDISFTRGEIVNHLENRGIQTRMLFAGNLIKHPCFDQMRTQNKGYRVVGEMKNTDRIMNQTFWVGVYPGMTEKVLVYMVKEIHNFVRQS